MAKYDIESSQTAYQPDSNDQVLANKLGIVDSSEMDEAELVLLEKLYERILTEQLLEGAITSEVIKDWHRQWLGAIYDWAGEERSVNMAKGDIHFAAAGRIPALLKTLDKDCLIKWTPCTDLEDEELIEAVAITHVEFILVHPFREGNGRISRLLADVMAAQAGFGTLDYSSWDENKEDYFAAIQLGLAGDYGPMMGWVEKAFNG
jgi:cell filamentation protein, protein adenylyltransferase